MRAAAKRRCFIFTFCVYYLNTTPMGPWRALSCPSKHPSPTQVQPEAAVPSPQGVGLTDFGPKKWKLRICLLHRQPFAAAGAGASHSAPVTVSVKGGCSEHRRTQAAPLSLAKPPTPASAAPGFAVPSPTTSPGLLLRFGSSLMAHPPLREPGARVKLLFSKLGFAPQVCFTAGTRWWQWPRVALSHTGGHTAQVIPWKPKPAPGSAIVSPCPLGWVSRRGKTTTKKSCLVCIHYSPLLPSWPQPTLPPRSTGICPGKGSALATRGKRAPETPNHSVGGYL